LNQSTFGLLLEAAIFKASALLEEYLSSVISDWLSAAMNQGQQSGSLPEELRWFVVSNAHRSEYEKYLNSRDETVLIRSLIAKQQNRLLSNAESLTGLIVPNSIIGDRKYPSPRNLKRLFYRLGVPNIFNRVDKRAHRAFEPILQSFLDIREAIAHQAPPALTLVDVENHFGNLQSFVSALDKEFCSFVCSKHGSNCWRRN
jgi:hypothetical protein